MAVDAATGRVEQRTLPVPPDVRTFWSDVDGSVEAYGTYDAQGMVRIYDAGSGDLVDQVEVPGDQRGRLLAMTPDGLFVLDGTSDGATFTSYGRPGMTPQWTDSLPVRRPQSAAVCGWAICATSELRTVLVEPSTGRQRVSSTDRVAGTVGTGVVLALRTHPPKIGVPHGDDVRILDPDTGELRSTVAMANPIDWRDSGGRALLVQRGDRSDAVVEVGASGRTRVLGRADGLWLSFCKARGATLACLDDSHHLRIWTLPLVRGSTA